MGTSAFDLSTLKPVSTPPSGGASAFDLSTLKPVQTTPTQTPQRTAAPAPPAAPSFGQRLSAGWQGLESGGLKGAETGFETGNAPVAPQSKPAQPVSGAALKAPAPPAPRPTTPYRPQATVSAAPTASLWDRARESVANSAVGAAVQSTMPKVAQALGLEPTESEASPTYQQNRQSMPQLPAWTQKPILPAIERGVTAINRAADPRSYTAAGRAVRAQEETQRAQQNAAYDAAHPYQAAVAQAGREFAEGMTTPTNLAQLALVPAAKPLMALYALQGANGTYDSIEQAWEAHKAGKNPEAVKLAAEAGLSGIVTAMAGRAALKGAFPVDTARPTVRDPLVEIPTERPMLTAGTPTTIEGTVPRNGGDGGGPRGRGGAGGGDETVPRNVPRGTVEQPLLTAGETKPILHDETASAADLTESAQKLKPILGDAVLAATKGVPGANLEAVRAKDLDRTVDKTDRQNVQPSQIGDISGAKVTVPDQQAADQVLQNLNRQMPVESVNGQVTGEPGKNGVRQVQATVRLPETGEPVKRAEVLIQTPEMNRASDQTHDDYRKAQELRQAGKDAEAQKLEDKIVRQHDEAERAAQQRLEASNAVPERGPAGVVQRPPQEVGVAGGERGRVEPIQQGQEVAAQGAQATGEKGQIEPRYKFGNTQANIPESSPASQALNRFRDQIPENHLAGDGRDVGAGGNHVTVRYGVKGEDTDEIQHYIEGQRPFTVRLGQTDVFPPTENSNGAAVVHAKIEAPELARINSEIEKHGDFEPSSFKDYKPHATIAYIDPAQAEAYRGRKDLAGKEFPVNSITISDRNGNQREVQLLGAGGAEQTQLGNRPAVGGHDGKPTELIVSPTNKMPATYRLVEASDLVPSHNAQSFEPNPAYPTGVQERDYKGSKAAQTRVIEQDGAITDRERPQFLDAQGGLSEEGKTFVERAMLGSVVNDSHLMDVAPKAILGKLEKSLGSIASIGSRPDEWNLLPVLRPALLRAVAEHASIAQRGSTVELTVNQRDMFGPGRNPLVDALVRVLDEKPNAVRAKFEAFAKDANQNLPDEARIFGGGQAFDAFNNAFGSKLSDEEFRNGIDELLNLKGSTAAAKRQETPTARPNAVVPQRAAGKSTLRAPAPPTGRTAAEPNSGGGSPRAARPTDLAPRAPAPPAATKSPFMEGRQKTAIELRTADGNWQPATLDYYNGGVNGQPRRGRVTLANGSKLNDVPESGMRLATKEAPAPANAPGSSDETVHPIGPPIEGDIANLVRDRISKGLPVKIFTRRISREPREANRRAVDAAIHEQFGVSLPITDVKTAGDGAIYDDSSNVEHNTGRILSHTTNPGDEGKPILVDLDGTLRKSIPSGVTSPGVPPGGEAITERGIEGGQGTSTAGQPNGAVPTEVGRQPQRGGAVEPVATREAEPAPTRAAEEPRDAEAVRREPAAADPEWSGTRGAHMQERLLAKGKFDRELSRAKASTEPENIVRAQANPIQLHGVQVAQLNADAFQFLSERLSPGVDWPGVFLDRRSASKWVAEIGARASKLRQEGMGAAADAAKKLQLALDGIREPDGSIVLLREDYNDSTIREELAHRWQTKTDLRGSYAQTEVSQRPEFEEVNQRLRDIGYDLSPEDQATELIAKALAGDPAMKWTPEQQNAVVSATLHAAIDEMGSGVLDDMAPYDPAVKTSVEEAKQYGKESNARTGGEAVRGVVETPDEGLSQVGRKQGSDLSEEPRNRPAGPGGQRGISEGRAAEGELGTFQRAPKPPASRALPGMERDIEAQRDAAAEEQGRQLTERLRAPRPPISRAAGIMERESPLFRDTDAGGQGSLFQRAIKDEETKTQNPWFLKSAKVIDAKMRGPMPGDALLHMLENNGVKPDEIKWSGLEDLRGEKRVTPDEVKEYLAVNATKINEVDKSAKTKGQDTRYASYVLPGGENYHELLLKLPDVERIPLGNPSFRQASFHGPHWDEPNVLGHIRFNDRTGPNGEKLLHIEELQSDWHQKGREKGYDIDPIENGSVLLTKPFKNEIDTGWAKPSDSVLRSTGGEGSAEVFSSEVEARAAARRFLAEVEGRPTSSTRGMTIPDAPFKKTWPELLFKRMVRYAAENGYDGISWTPGKKQAERYDLSKQVSEITYRGNDRLIVRGTNGSVIHNDIVPPEKLPDVIGKEAAQKLLAMEPTHGSDDVSIGAKSRRLYPEDLKVGGEGMTGFYDKIVPDMANKIGKQFGAKVGTTEIQVAAEKGAEAAHIVPATLGGFKVADAADHTLAGPFDTRAEAEDEVDRMKKSGPLAVQYLPVTDEMRGRVMSEGQPLFTKSEKGPGRADEDDAARMAREGLPLKEERPKPRETTATTGKHDIDKGIDETIDELGKLPKRKMSASEHMDQAVDAATKGVTEKTEAVKGAFAGVKGAAAGAWSTWCTPPAWSDYRQSLSDLRSAEFKAARQVDVYQKTLVKVAPSERERNAITIYGEAESAAQLKHWQMAARAIPNIPKEAVRAFDDALKLTPEQKSVAEAHRDYYSQQLKILTDAGLLPTGASNYTMHMFASDPETLSRLNSVTNLNELSPNPSFLNKRVYPSFFEAIKNGEKPTTLDAGKILSAYHDAFTKTFMTRSFIRSLIYGNAKDGRPLAILESRAGTTVLDKKGTSGARILKQPKRPEDMSDYVRDPAGQMKNFTWELTDEDREMLAPGYSQMPKDEQSKLFGPDDPRFPVPAGKVLALRGDILLHPEVAKQVHDLVTKSWFKTKPGKTWGAMTGPERVEEGARLGLNAIGTAGATAKGVILYGSGFHQVQLSVHSMEHLVNPFRLPSMDEQANNPIVLEGVAHGLNLLNIDTTGVLSTLPGMGTYHRYLFRDYIPRLKAEMYKQAFARNMERFGGAKDGKAATMTRDEIHLLTAQQANAAFGGLDPAFFEQLNRMNNKTYQAIEHLLLFSPDFTKARIQFAAQGIGEIPRLAARVAAKPFKSTQTPPPLHTEQLAALLRGALVMYGICRITNAVINRDQGAKGAHWDWQDALVVVTPKSWGVLGDKHIGLRMVQGDMMELIKNPVTWAYNRLNPATLRPAIEFLTGRDNFGRQESKMNFAKNYLKQMAPIQVQKLFTTSDEGWVDSLFTSAGLQLGNYRSPLEQEAHELRLSDIPDRPGTEEKMDEARANVQEVKKLRDAGAIGENPSAWPEPAQKMVDDIRDKVANGKMSSRAASTIILRAGMTEFQYDVLHLSMDDAMSIWNKAGAGERAELKDVITEKASRSLEATAKDKGIDATNELEARLKDKGITVGPQ